MTSKWPLPLPWVQYRHYLPPSLPQPIFIYPFRSLSYFKSPRFLWPEKVKVWMVNISNVFLQLFTLWLHCTIPCLVFSSGNGVMLKRCGYVLFRKTFFCSLQINVYIKYALKILDLVYVSLLHSFFLSLSHSLSLSLFCSPYPIISPIISPLSPPFFTFWYEHITIFTQQCYMCPYTPGMDIVASVLMVTSETVMSEKLAS